MKKKQSNQFCLDILQLNVRRKKALANLVMALSSYKSSSVVSLSESPLFHYQYSSITDAITHLASDNDSLLTIEKQISALCLNDYWQNIKEEIILQTDKTVICKAHSPVISNRHLIKVPNRNIPGSRPLDIGCEYSFVNLVSHSWSLPLSGRLIPLNQTASELAVAQLQDLMTNEELPLKDIPRVINTLDTGYASATYVDGVKEIENLISIVRLRKSSKVFAMASQEDQIPGKSRKIYGSCFYLILQSGFKKYKKHPKTGQPYQVWQDAIVDRTPDQQLIIQRTLSNGRLINVELSYWQDQILRTKNGIRMDDKPFSLVLVQAFDNQRGHLLFKQPMFLAVFGKKRLVLNCEQIYDDYQQRYGIEPFFGFAKRNLHLQSFQGLSSQQINNWMFIIILSVWLLFTARTQVINRPKKWQKYNPVEKNTKPGNVLTIAQTYKALQAYLLTFDPTPFLPQKSKPGPGRQKGETQTPRIIYKWSKKNTHATRNKTLARAGPI